MRALWHLAINSVAGRRGRTALLVLAVALATTLTVAVAAAIGTISRSVSHAVDRVAGRGDLSIRRRFAGSLPADILPKVRAWPEVLLAGGYVEGGATLRLKRTGRSYTALLRGADRAVDEKLDPRDYLEGHGVGDDGEIVLGPRLRRKLRARLGDVIDVAATGGKARLTVVGLFDRPRLSVMQRPTAGASLAKAREVLARTEGFDEVRLRLRPDADADALAAKRKDSLGTSVEIHTSASVQTGLARHLRFAKLLLTILTVMASLSSGFLILTTLTTAVTQQTREMGILRCIGAGRAQLAAGQLTAGVLIASLGAAIGTPLGLLAAYGLYAWFHDALPGGFSPDPAWVAAAAGGSVLAGLLGAAYPAVIASRSQPLEALTVRARPPRARHVVFCTVAGGALVALQPLVLALKLDADTTFWFWAYCGLPAGFIGAFLLSVPLLVCLAHAAARPLSRLLRLPGNLLSESLLATPLRNGFTGGTLMVSLALLVAAWMQGRSLTAGFLQPLKLPDAFVYKLTSFSDEQIRAVAEADAVTRTCPTVTLPVRVVGMQFGLREMSPPETLFMGTDVAAFLAMTEFDFHAGDRRTALRRLAAGRALLVAKEWAVTQGVGVGTRLAIQTVSGPVDFEVVGVIGSRGLSLAAHVFGVRRRLRGAAVSSVIGTRDDARRYFGAQHANLMLVSLRDDVTDEDAVNQLTEAAPGSLAGTSRKIHRRLARSLNRAMSVLSTLAFGSLVLACLGVGNLIVAEVAARRFEFGVLRAMGAQRGLLGRLVAAQTLLVGLVGCVAGTGLGVLLALTERAFHRRLLGLEYDPRLPWDVIAVGTAGVLAAALLSALPAVWGLMRRCPRALLARRD